MIASPTSKFLFAELIFNNPFSPAEIIKSISRHNHPYSVRESSAHPLKRCSPRYFFEAHNIPETGMAWFPAGVSGVGWVRRRWGRWLDGSWGDGLLAAPFGGLLEALVFYSKVSVRDMHHTEGCASREQ